MDHNYNDENNNEEKLNQNKSKKIAKTIFLIVIGLGLILICSGLLMKII